MHLGNYRRQSIYRPYLGVSRNCNGGISLRSRPIADCNVSLDAVGYSHDVLSESEFPEDLGIIECQH